MFREMLIEAKKLTKTEATFMDKFTEPNQEVKIIHYKGTGRIRGGGKAEGKKDFETTLKLVDKGILTLISKENTSMTHSYLVVKSNVPVNTELDTMDEIIWQYVQEWNDGDKLRDFMKLSKKDEKKFKRLAKLGYFKDDVFEPTIYKPYK